MLSPDTLLQNRYRILRHLGAGGMGAVYLATDERLGSTVALKETFFAEEVFKRAFEREARLLASLRHPALPKVIDHFGENDGQFLVMEYIAGEDLEKQLKHNSGTAFSPGEVLRWGDQLLDALDYLHTQDPPIIHRDIKPQNLKLSGRGQIVLLDFGLAKGSAGQMSHLSTTGSIFGYTPNYAPLEQIQGAGTDARSDLYSLSATLYHLLTNTKPPDALSRVSAAVEGQPDPLLPAHEINPGISPLVSSFLNQGMALNRHQRPATAAVMRGLLQSVVAKEKAGGSTVINSPPQPNTVLQPSPTEIVGQGGTLGYHHPQTETRPDARPTQHSTPVDPTANPQTRIDESAIVASTRRFAPLPLVAGFVGLGILLALVALFALTRSSDAPDAQKEQLAVSLQTAPPLPTEKPATVPVIEALPSPTLLPMTEVRPQADPTTAPTTRPRPLQTAQPELPTPTPAPEPIRVPPDSTDLVAVGALDGRAVIKPQPVYPPKARMRGVFGTVAVQVLVGPGGRVIAARPVSGPPVLRKAAVDAAYQARFAPTMQAGRPMRVTGTLTYNFAP